jgi:hypothetical protein
MPLGAETPPLKLILQWLTEPFFWPRTRKNLPAWMVNTTLIAALPDPLELLKRLQKITFLPWHGFRF